MILDKFKDILFISCIIGILIINACTPPVEYSDIPEIKFKEFEFSEDTDALGNKVKKGTLSFNIIDGDGNVGLKEEDTIGPFHRDSLYFHDVFIKLDKKVNNTYEEIQLVIPHNFRLPYLEPQGRNKTLKALIKVDFEYNLLFFQYDTVRYRFYLVDRNLNKSNIDTTPDIPVKENGIIIGQ